MVPELSVPGEGAGTSHIVGPSGQDSLSDKGVEEGETEGSHSLFFPIPFLRQVDGLKVKLDTISRLVKYKNNPQTREKPCYNFPCLYLH